MYSLGQQSDRAIVSYYDILRIRTGATEEEIKAAYHKLAKRFHPDRVRSGTPADRRMAELRFRLINEAYSNLNTKEKRERYNRLLRHRLRKNKKIVLRAQNDNGSKSGFFGLLSDLFRSPDSRVETGSGTERS